MVDIIEKVYNNLEREHTPEGWHYTHCHNQKDLSGGGHTCSEGDTGGEARQCYFEISPTGCTPTPSVESDVHG